MGNTASKEDSDDIDVTVDSGNMIYISKSNRTGAYMNQWRSVIGEHSNELIAKDLKSALMEQSKLLMLDKTKLNHRDSGLMNSEKEHVQIVDLIEPCKPTTASPSNDAAVAEAQYKLETALFLGGLPPDDSNINAWVPAVFRLNEQSKQYEIVSEINDLPRSQYGKLYEILQRIFTEMVPQINRCLAVYPCDSGSFQYHLGDSGNAIQHVKTMQKTIRNTEKEKVVAHKEYSVIVKMTDYQFMNAGLCRYGGGKYHSEGFPKEHIAAAALYYFDISSNVMGGGLQFSEQTYRHFGGADTAQISLRDGECVFFSNQQPYKHKACGMHCLGKKQDIQDKHENDIFGTRKLLGFFVVDPERRDQVKTSLDIVVNLEAAVKKLIERWNRKERQTEHGDDAKLDKDVLSVIQAFVCGDMKYIKEKTDEYRAQRYLFGQKQASWEETKLASEQTSMAGVCD